MNEETTAATEVTETIPTEETSPSMETTIPVTMELVPEAEDEETTPETTETILFVTEAVPEETMEAITLEEVRQIRDDIINTDLFGSFLVCGAIVGCALLRRFV